LLQSIEFDFVSLNSESWINFQNHIILAYIIRGEDHFGDMYIKICGALWHIAGFQVDLKIKDRMFGIAKEATYHKTRVHKIGLLHEITRHSKLLTRDDCQFFSMAMQGNEM
jgi:polyribonucleotide nucleotidyltransferase